MYRRSRMWRSVAIGIVLAGVLGGCGISGGSPGQGGLLGSLSETPNAKNAVRPADAVASLKQAGVYHVISGAAGSPVGKGVRLPDAGDLHITWVAAGGYGSDAPAPPLGTTVGTVQLFAAPSSADAGRYAAAHPPELEPDVNGGTFFGRYRNVIIKVGGTPARAASFELAQVVRALARGASGSNPPTTTENIASERRAIKHEVAKWLSHHPGGHCKIELPDSANCAAANGLPTDIVVGSDTEVVTTP